MEILSFLLAPVGIKWILVKRVNSCGGVFARALMFYYYRKKKQKDGKKAKSNIGEPALKRRGVDGCEGSRLQRSDRCLRPAWGSSGSTEITEPEGHKCSSKIKGPRIQALA